MPKDSKNQDALKPLQMEISCVEAYLVMGWQVTSFISNSKSVEPIHEIWV